MAKHKRKLNHHHHHHSPHNVCDEHLRNGLRFALVTWLKCRGIEIPKALKDNIVGLLFRNVVNMVKGRV